MEPPQKPGGINLELRRLREELAVRDRPAAVTGADGVTRRAVETGHERLLATIFGTVTVGRCAWRAQARRNVYPADAALRLPRLRHSHGLQRLAALEAVRGSFDQATEAIGRRCGQVVGKRQVELLTVAAAADSEQVIQAVFDQAEQRDPTHRRTWVVLVDGARHQLDLARAEAARRGVRVHILIDLIHVLEYLWKAAWCFHADGDPQAEAWVATHAISTLSGQAA